MDFTSNSPLSDTERVSEWAAIALREGRIELGAALARLAVQALRVSRTPPSAPITATAPAPVVDDVPMLRAVPAWRETLAQAAHTGPTGNGDADVQREVEALHAYTGGIVTTPPVPTPRRCQAPIVLDGLTIECGGGAYFVEAGRYWAHVDTALDRDHGALVAL